ncbi:MAG: T9SS type A sorting domain-containing protein [Candidatus Kapaibacterium sp.]
MKTIIFVILFLPAFLFAGEWVEVDHIREDPDHNGVPLGMKYQVIDCIDEDNCVAFGDLGLIVPWARYTTDGGHTWHSSRIDSQYYKYNDDGHRQLIDPPYLYDGIYISDSLALAFGGDRTLWRSDDQFKSWTSTTFGPKGSVAKVEYMNENSILLLSSSELFLSRDQAKTWERYPMDIDQINNMLGIEGGGVHDIVAINENTIYAMADSPFDKEKEMYYFLIKTTDRGNTWHHIKTFPTIISGFFFEDEMTGWFYGGEQEYWGSSNYSQLIMKTTDGGNTWDTKLEVKLDYSKSISYLKFFNESEGIAFARWDKIFRTSDGGETWQYDSSLATADIPATIVDISAPTKDVLYGAAGMWCTIYKYDGSVSVGPLPRPVPEALVWPNPLPRGERLNIRLGGEFAHANVYIYNISGELIDSHSFASAPGRELRYLPDKSMPAGAYMLLIETPGSTISRQIIYE